MISINQSEQDIDSQKLATEKAGFNVDATRFISEVVSGSTQASLSTTLRNSG